MVIFFIDINRIGAIYIYAWYAIVVVSMINISIIYDITNEGVDLPPIINVNVKKGGIIF